MLAAGCTAAGPDRDTTVLRETALLCDGAAPRAEAATAYVEATRGSALLAMACGLVRREQDVEDLVQDVLATALLTWRRVSAADDPAAHLNRMLVNAATSWWRRPVRREHPAEVEPDGVVDDPAAAAGERDALLAALRTLPVRHRTVFVLRYDEGLPDAEIAALVGVAEATVRSWAHRGLESLRLTGAGASPTALPGEPAARPTLSW